MVAYLAFGTPASGAKPLMDGRWVTSVLQMFLQQCLKSCLGQGADRAVDLLAVLKDDQRGDAHDAKLHGQVLVVVDVALGHSQLAGQLVGNLVYDGRERAAGRTTGPKINQYGQAVVNDGIEVLGVICLMSAMVTSIIRRGSAA